MKRIIDNIFFSDNIKNDLKDFLKNKDFEKIFVLTDFNTKKYCFPLIEESFYELPAIFSIPPGEAYKNINTAVDVWRFLSKNGATRRSLLINLGGGVVTDLGGFVASTFKRGISFVNIPTTLLAQVDAAIGGKTGINLDYLKNEVGTFSDSEMIFISTDFLRTLPERQLISGFAEIVKHALIDSVEAWNYIKMINPENLNLDLLAQIVPVSIKTKINYVKSDFREKGRREALNFGHTFGHAIETFFNLKGIDILHGEAVAIGMICEIFLSNQKFIFDFAKVFEISEYLSSFFPSYKIAYKDYEDIYEIMLHDKKNKEGKIRFSLLEDIGKVKINQTAEKKDIFEALNFYYQMA